MHINDILRPIIRKDISTLFDFNNSLSVNYSDLKSYESLINLTTNLNSNLTEILSLMSEKMDTFFTQIYFKFVNEIWVYKIYTNLLVNEVNLSIKPIHCPGYSWDVLNSLNLVKNSVNLTNFNEVKKSL